MNSAAQGRTPLEWDERYRAPGYLYGTLPNQFLESVAGQIPGGRVLMLAEGEGRNAVFLVSLGYEVTAVDSSVVGLQKAERLARERGVQVELLQADLADYRIEPDSWSGIVACYCHLPLALRQAVHRASVTGLKQGGVFILEAFSKQQLNYQTGGPKSLEMLMSLAELQTELAGLQFRHGVELEREVREGSGHTGLAAVVQLLGVKV